MDLSLGEYRRRVLERNEGLQLRLLEFEANRSRYRAERGAFEPDLFASYAHVYDNRENTVEQQRSTLSNTFEEENNVYEGGLESLVPSGARVRLGYTMRDLNNNLQDQAMFQSRGATNGEWQSFFGLTLSQPLLKNAGFTANLAALRIAGLGSKIAFQEYRRQLMVVVTTAEAAYWSLYFAQEQVRFFEESVRTAETVLADNRTRLQAGKGTELEVLEAEAGLALRQSKLSEARQKHREALNRLLALSSQPLDATNGVVRAVEAPVLTGMETDSQELRSQAFRLNPDYLIQETKLGQEGIRVRYAKNQRMPSLDLKGSAGVSGLGSTPNASWQDITSGDWPAWSVGVEFRMPIGGGAKTRNELMAARVREQQAVVGLRELTVQILTGLDTARQKLESTRRTAESYASQVAFNEKLLEAALARLEAGKVESRKVLEIESDLFEARNSRVDATVQYRRALLELELLQGNALERRDLEISQEALQKATYLLASRGAITEEVYQDVLRRVQALYEQNRLGRAAAKTP